MGIALVEFRVTPLYDKMASQNKYFVLETTYSIMAYTRLSRILPRRINILLLRKSLLFNRGEKLYILASIDFVETKSVISII